LNFKVEKEMKAPYSNWIWKPLSIISGLNALLIQQINKQWWRGAESTDQITLTMKNEISATQVRRTI